MEKRKEKELQSSIKQSNQTPSIKNVNNDQTTSADNLIQKKNQNKKTAFASVDAQENKQIKIELKKMQ